VSHLITGKKALILPALSRVDEDVVEGKVQSTTIEDAMCKISFSKGCLPSPSEKVKSEIAIVAEMARTTLINKYNIDWDYLKTDYKAIRKAIAEVVPMLREFDKNHNSEQEFYCENPLRNNIFNTSDKKAKFSNYPLQKELVDPGELLLMTIRSHDQFNTSIFGMNDRYRGINNERRVLFMNQHDMDQRNILPERLVQITSNYDNKIRKMDGYIAIPYPIKKGCVAAYFPEANILTSINEVSPHCYTPAYKSIRVKVVVSLRAQS